jgi:hypothetical protein
MFLLVFCILSSSSDLKCCYIFHFFLPVKLSMLTKVYHRSRADLLYSYLYTRCFHRKVLNIYSWVPAWIVPFIGVIEASIRTTNQPIIRENKALGHTYNIIGR